MAGFVRLVFFIISIGLLAGCVSATAGDEWVKVSDPGLFPERHEHTSVVYDGKIWVIGGAGVKGSLNDVWYSTDGKTWTQATEHAAFEARYGHTSLVYDGKLWVIGGEGENGSLNDVWYSTDGKTWELAKEHAAFPAREGHTSVIYDGKIWVIGGVNHENGSRNLLNDVWYSTDGKTWIQATEHAAFEVRYGHSSVVYDGKMWVIGGRGLNGYVWYLQDVWYSTDGKTWIQISECDARPGRAMHTSVVFDNKIWVIGGERVEPMGHYFTTSEVWYSTNGANWTRADQTSFPFPELTGHTSVVYNECVWAIGGSPMNDVWYSTDGKNWIQAYDHNIPFHLLSHLVEFDNKIWIIGGKGKNGEYLNDTYYSTDGITWTQATEHAAFEARYGHTSVTYDGKLWVIGGTGPYNGLFNDTWYSSDGINWELGAGQAAFPARGGHTSVVYDGKIWVIGGVNHENSSWNLLNDTWYSSDGINWELGAGQAAFPARGGHTSVIYDGKIWVIGGTGPDNRVFNDTWYSIDGTNWELATEHAAFPARALHTSVVYDGKMWMIGGVSDMMGSSISLNDVWYSTDGKTWLQASAPVSAGYWHSSVVNDGKIWVIGYEAKYPFLITYVGYTESSSGNGTAPPSSPPTQSPLPLAITITAAGAALLLFRRHRMKP